MYNNRDERSDGSKYTPGGFERCVEKEWLDDDDYDEGHYCNFNDWGIRCGDGRACTDEFVYILHVGEIRIT